LSILVDNPVNLGKGIIEGHMVSNSSLKELHKFAKSLGIKKSEYAMSSGGFAFYKVNIFKRLKALELGAKEASATELMIASQKMSRFS